MGDEILTYHLGSLPSIFDLLKGLSLGADSHGPLYHSLNWLWTQLGNLVGAKPEIWTRLPSIILMGTGLLILKAVFDSQLPKPLGLLLVLSLLTWEPWLRHLGENRSYGLVIFLVCSQIFTAQKYLETQKKVYLYIILIITSVSILSHPMAYTYSMTVVVALFFYGLYKRQIDLKPVGYALAGSLTIIPWLIAYFGQIESTMSGSVSWASPPTISQLFEFIRINNLLIVLILLGVIALLINGHNKATSNKFWIITGTGFVLFSFGLWVLSQKTNPLFLERYILPNQIGWSLIVGGLLRVVFKDNISKVLRTLLYLLAIGVMLYTLSLPIPTRDATGGYWNKESPWTDAGFSDDKYFTEKIPVVCESSTVYLPRNFYHGRKREYFLILNEEAAQESKGIWLMDYNMTNALREVDKAQKIRTWEEFLPTHKRFYLINEGDGKQDEVL